MMAAQPVLELDRVHARDAAGVQGAARGTLAGASIALGPGVHAFLGAPEDGTLALADVITGARRPQRGRVTIAGRDPASTPFVRAKIGVLAAEPRLPAAPTVRAAVRLAMRARGETGDRLDAVLEPLGLSPLQARDPRSLAFGEQRAVELALALSAPAPLLLALHEPLADVAVPRLDALLIRLREAASAGACVILTTSSPADARALADHVLVLHRGLVAREVRLDLAPGHDGGDPHTPGLVSGAGATLRAWVRAGARDLCAALALRSEVRAVSWQESPSEPTLVTLSGDHAEAAALALVETALACGAELDAFTEDAPGLGEVRTATETLWRMMTSRPAPAPAPAPAPVPAVVPAAAPAPPEATPQQGADP